jgi:3-dehydroquinate dehydratase / shikimate dehydrogenase
MQAILVAAVDRVPEARELQALDPSAWLEVRGDGAVPAAEPFRQHFAGKLLFTLRSPHNRAALLRRAAESYDFVELQPGDLDAETFAAIPPERRVITGSDETILATPARLYRVIVEPRGYADTVRPLHLLRSLGRRDVIAYASGPLGTWTRIVAPQFGAPFVFGKLHGDVAVDGTPTLAQLHTDYGFPQLTVADEIYGIAGDPIFSSLSPRLHNAAFRALGRRALYVPFHVPSFDDFWDGLITAGELDALGLPIRTICVVSPYKQAALPSADAHTPMVERAQSTNFFVREGHGWTADTTDPAGVLLALQDRGIDVADMPVAVVGCGGSGRAIAAALHQAGADVTLVNRGQERARLAVHLLHLPFVPLADFAPERYGLLVNATPMGRGGERLSALENIRADAVVIDLVYGARPTPLIAATRANGQVAVDGKEILMRQAMSQFRLMTGQEMPEALVRGILELPRVEAAMAAETQH